MLSKQETSYHIAKPEQDRCGECKWFDRHDSCKWVAGRISPYGWCELFHRKQSSSRLAGKSESDRAYVRTMREAK